MNVLYLLNYAGKAGTERYVETLTRSLMSDGRITPFFAYNIEGLLVERMEAMGVPTRQIEMKGRFDRKAARALSDLCREWEIDLIHAQFLRENYIAMLSKQWNPSVKVVYTSHFVMANNWYTRASNRRLSPRQDGVISVCTVGKEQLVKNDLDPPNIEVIFNGVDPSVWAKQPDAPSTLRQELGVSEDVCVMLCASRFADDKGHAYLIRAIERLAGMTDLPFHLALAGDGPLLEPTRAQVQAAGLSQKVTFLGFRRDMANLFHGSDFYVSPSLHEALSFLIIEAMAAGLPVVATNVGGNSDIVNEETACGLMVEYDDDAQLADALLWMLEHPEERERLRNGAEKAAETRFHIDRMVEKTYRLYETVTREGRLGGPRLRGAAAKRQKQAYLNELHETRAAGKARQPEDQTDAAEGGRDA